MSLDKFFKMYMPYCIELLDDNCIRVLNREYYSLTGTKLSPQNAVDAKSPPVMKLTWDRDYESIKLLGIYVEEDKRIFLYSDNTSPSISKDFMNDYLEKIAILGSFDLENAK